MLSISTAHQVAWPQPVAPTVAPVAGVLAVRPTAGAQRDGQTGLDSGREGQHRAQHGATLRNSGNPGAQDGELGTAAALLPRASTSSVSDAAWERLAQDSDGLPRSGVDQERQLVLAERAAQNVQAQQAATQQLQDVLTHVWQASAAVVDRALSRAQPDASAASSTPLSNAAAGSPAVAVVQPAAQEPLLRPLLPESSQQGVAFAVAPDPPRPAQEVLAYDENGSSSPAPPEPGALISRWV